MAVFIMGYWQSYYIKERVPSSRVKEDIVNYSKLKWPLLFSRFYEAFRSSGTRQFISFLPPGPGPIIVNSQFTFLNPPFTRLVYRS